MKNKFVKAMATFAATFLMISVATVNVVWAAPKVPSDCTVGTINSLLAQNSRWKFFYNGGSIKNGVLHMNFQNGAASGEAIASPMVQLQKNQLIKFVYNSPFSTGALMQSYALFEFRLPLGDRHTGIQDQYYAFLLAPGAEMKNVWLCYSKEGFNPGGKVIKFSHKIAKDTDYVITCGAVETANGVRLLLYIDDTCVIDLEDTSTDKKIEGDPLTKGSYVSPYNFNFYTMKDDYTIKGTSGTPLDLATTKVDVLPEYDKETNRPIKKTSSTTSTAANSSKTTNTTSHTATNTNSKGSTSVTANTESAASKAESTTMTESETSSMSENIASQAVESNQTTDSGKSEKKSPVALIVTIVVIVVVLAAAGAAYYFIQNKKANKQ